MTIIPYYIITGHHEGHDGAECGHDNWQHMRAHEPLTGAENVDIGTHWHPAQSLHSDYLECNQVANT